MEMQTSSKEGEDYEEASGSSVKAKTKALEEAEPDPYSKLQSPSDDIYSEALFSGSPVKAAADAPTGRNARLYRAVCVFLTTVCLVLLLIVIILSVKLQTGSRDDDAHCFSSNASCSLEQCQAQVVKFQTRALWCRQCPLGWLRFEQSCFFLSTHRLSWGESQKYCSTKGGSLAVINSLGIQRFLTDHGQLFYWIGLTREKKDGHKWTWINDTEPINSYWGDYKEEGDCGILRSEDPPEKNWIMARCPSYTYFICQFQI